MSAEGVGNVWRDHPPSQQERESNPLWWGVSEGYEIMGKFYELHLLVAHGPDAWQMFEYPELRAVDTQDLIVRWCAVSACPPPALSDQDPDCETYQISGVPSALIQKGEC